MNRRDLLRGLVAMPVASAFSSCTQSVSQRPGPVTTLKVILDGSFAVVFERQNPTRITAVIPHDPDKLHRFYFNDFFKPMDNGQDANRYYNFQLSSKGLEENQARRPYTDQCFRDFSKHSDWKREKYFVTIELPVPDVITFIPPAASVIFRRSHQQVLMPLNHVLRYRVQNVDEVQMTQQGSKPVKPLSNSDFEKEYYRWCKDPNTGARSGHCGQMQEHSSEWSEDNAVTYYFAVGTTSYQQAPASSSKAEDHAIRFFNEILLRSFPKAQPELQLE